MVEALEAYKRRMELRALHSWEVDRLEYAILAPHMSKHERRTRRPRLPDILRTSRDGRRSGSTNRRG